VFLHKRRNHVQGHFFSDQQIMPLPSGVATRLRVFCFAVRTTGPPSLICDSEYLRKPKVLTQIPQDGMYAASVVSQSVFTSA
jgi:hypothetical protein